MPTSAARTASLDVPDRLGSFRFDAVLDAVTDPLVRRSPFAMATLRLFLGTFASSAGRQYAQLCDMVALVALLQRRAAPSAADWRTLRSAAMIETVAALPLPDGHTRSPLRTPGQVGGVYRFWWLALRDAFELRHHGTPLPGPVALDNRMAACGVPLYVTSSSTWEELAGLRASFAGYRDDPTAATAPPEVLARRCLEPHLAGELHWQTHRRPRGRTGDGRPDGHELGLRTHILDAVATPTHRRSVYDELFLLLRDRLDRVIETRHRDPAARRLADLHARVVTAYNANHPDAPITALHR